MTMTARAMTAAASKVWLAGIDGCPGGWLVVLIEPDGDAYEIAFHREIADALRMPQQPAVIAIDMPIGLPERGGIGGRAAENAIRPLLGARQSSVFSVPPRAAVEAENYADACARALAASDPPRKVSKQLFNIAPKIRALDAVLRNDASLRDRCHEVHPELAFWRLNGERALTQPKKIKSRPHPAGLAQRRAILAAAGLPAAVLDAAPPRTAQPDDLLDAAASAAIARRIHQGLAQPFPDPPPKDAYGLPMAIWA